MVWGILVRRTSKVDLVTNLLPLGSCTALLRKQSLNAPHVHNLKRFSRLRSRRVPVFKVGVQGSRRRARSLRLCSQAFAIVRNPSQSSTIIRRASDLCRTCAGLAGDANRRKTQNCRHFLRSVLQQCQQSQGSRGSWPRNAELSSLLDSSRVFAFQKCQQSQGSRGSWSRNAKTVVTFGLVSSLRVSKVSTVTGIAGVVVAKRRTVVTVGLVSGLRVSKVSTVTGIAGVVVAKRRTVVTFGLVSSLRVSKVSIVTGIAGAVVAKRSTVVTFGLASGSSRFNSVNSHTQGSGGSWPRNAEVSSLFGLISGLRVSKVSTVTGIAGVVVAKRTTVVNFGLVSGSSRLKSVNSHRDRGGRGRETQKLSSLLDSSRVFASQKCQQSQGSRGSWSRNAELSSLLDSSPGLRVSKVSTVTGIAGVMVAKRRTVVTFGLASGEKKGEGERRQEKREMRTEKGLGNTPAAQCT